jgi:Cytochrome b5-like Heme/Steroid binding domain
MTWKQQIYTPEEVAVHNIAEDCWVSIFDKVYDVTELIAENRGVLADPIIRSAGCSISDWFDEKTRDVKTYVDPKRNIVVPYTPHGRFIHVPSSEPSDEDIVETPWWLDNRYIIGKVRSSDFKE